ncbi:MAG: ribosome-binding factor A [Saprospiraceae bacterium]|nr:ribosome-binding factor A [Saprospiraceae bacterium]
METKRQRQVAQVVKRHFASVLREEGSYVFGHEALVTVTDVKMSPDMGLAKIYLSVYNVLDKQSVISLLEGSHRRLQSSLYHRIRKHVRRMPSFQMYLDDTLDEMYRLRDLFDRLEKDNQMGNPSSDSEE